VLVWSLWIPASLAVAALIRRWPLVPARPGPIALHLAVASLFGILHAVLWVALVLWMKPYDFMNPTAFAGFFADVAISQMPLEWVLYGLVALAIYTRAAFRAARERELRAAQLETSLAEARLHALEVQIQPPLPVQHAERDRRAGTDRQERRGGGHDRRTVGPPALRARPRGRRARAARRGDGDAGALPRDPDAALPDRLATSIEVAAGAGRAAVPVLLLQPLAENAIRHGIARSDAPGRVALKAFRDGDSLKLEMWNTGRSIRRGKTASGSRPRSRGWPSSTASASASCWRRRTAACWRASRFPGVRMIRVLIVDDEPLARQVVRMLLDEDPEVEVVGECSGADGVAVVERTRPDVLFLDVQMPEVDGFDLLEQLGPSRAPTTVFRDRVRGPRGARVRGACPRLSPEADRRRPLRARALGRAKEQVRLRERGAPDPRVSALLESRGRFARRFLVRGRDRTLVVKAEDIDWIEAADYYVSLHVGNASHLLRETMNELEGKLDPETFFRVHRSSIINLERVREIQPLFRGDCDLVLESGKKVRLSRTRRAEFERLFTGLGDSPQA
jgi:two-component system LytT family response regulator